MREKLVNVGWTPPKNSNLPLFIWWVRGFSKCTGLCLCEVCGRLKIVQIRILHDTLGRLFLVLYLCSLPCIWSSSQWHVKFCPLRKPLQSPCFSYLQRQMNELKAEVSSSLHQVPAGVPACRHFWIHLGLFRYYLLLNISYCRCGWCL